MQTSASRWTFPLFLFSWKRFLTLTQILNGLGCCAFLHHNVKDFKQDGAVQIQDDRVIATDGVIMRNKHKFLVHLYCYRCIDDKEQGNNDEENVAKVNIVCTSEESASSC